MHTIPDQEAFRSLAERSDDKGLCRFAGHLGLLLMTGMLVAASEHLLVLIPAMLLHGIVLVFLFCAEHESIHRTAFKRRSLNDCAAWFCGLLICLPPNYFRAFHFAHHRHTQNPRRDPELATPKPADLRSYFYHLSGLPYWLERLATTCRHAAGRVDEPFIRTAQRQAVRREARVFCGIYAAIGAISLAAGSGLVLIFWVLPALLGQPFLRALLLAEHTGCPAVPDMLRNSRTTVTLAPLRWLTWNMPFHAEHHAFPALPFHALPKAHQSLAPRIEVTADGYFNLHREFIARLALARPR